MQRLLHMAFLDQLVLVYFFYLYFVATLLKLDILTLLPHLLMFFYNSGELISGLTLSFLFLIQVRAHIDSFPRQKSHYSRSDNPNKEYIEEGWSIQVSETGFLPISTDFYTAKKNVFVEGSIKLVYCILAPKLFTNIFGCGWQGSKLRKN